MFIALGESGTILLNAISVMGVKELWSILNPYCERKPLYQLQGKVVAIDLAGWICESLCVVDYVVQAKFYLRYTKIPNAPHRRAIADKL